MNKLIAVLTLLAALCTIAGAAPTVLPTTTLSSAVTSNQNYVFLASVSNVEPGPVEPVSNGDIGHPVGASWTVLYIGAEAIRVTETPGTSSQPVYVERGWQGTGTEAHNSGRSGLGGDAQPVVSDTSPRCCRPAPAPAPQLSVVPEINIRTGQFSDCLGGVGHRLRYAAAAFHIDRR